jgi:hypothetical protein
MQDELSIQTFFKNQAELATLLAGEQPVPRKYRLRAFKIWHGQEPGDDDMPKIYEATKGKLDANFFAGLKSLKITNRKK